MEQRQQGVDGPRPMPWAVGGVVLSMAFVSFRFNSDHPRVTFGGGWDHVSASEAWFWMACLLLLMPAGACLGVAASGWLERVRGALLTRTADATPRERRLAWVAGLLGYAAVSQLANALLFHGIPTTDDEYAALFGGQVWAAGQWTMARPPWLEAAPQLFLFVRDGHLASFDFPGGLLAWAVSLTLGLGTWLFSLAAGATASSVAALVHRRFGPLWALFAGLCVVVSPQVALLSASSHAMQISRAGLAGCFALVLFVEQPSARRAAFAGLLLGLAGITRPAEALMLSAPVMGSFLVETLKAGRGRVALAFIGAALVPVAFFFLANWQMAHSLLPLRMLPNEVVHPYSSYFRGPFDLAAWLERFGNNVTYNGMMLALFLLGPLAVPFMVLGSRQDAVLRRLGWGVVLVLLLGLTHDDLGVHAMGSIHSSEAAIAALVLAIAGLRAALQAVAKLGGAPVAARGALVGYVLLGVGGLSAGYFEGHFHSTELQASVYELVDAAEPRPAVVLAPRFADDVVRSLDPERRGLWVFSWRRVHAFADEPVVVLHDSERARAAVRGWFPERRPFVLSRQATGWSLTPLEQAGPPLPVADDASWRDLSPPKR